MVSIGAKEGKYVVFDADAEHVLAIMSTQDVY